MIYEVLIRRNQSSNRWLYGVLPTLIIIKPNQNDIQKDPRTKHIRNIRTDKV